MEIPKNIRQIGENNTDNRIYIEDYVITYLQQIGEDLEYGSRAVLLLGHVEEKEELHCFYISGAVMTQKKRIDRNDFIFDEIDKEYLLEQKRLYFSGLEILGWAVIENEFNKVYAESVWSDSADVFHEDNKLFCKISNEYNEKKWYLKKNGIVKQIHGYAIFYDQNEKMQNYLILWHKEKNQPMAEEVSDRAAKKFRSLAMRRQEYNEGRHPGTFFYLLGTFLFMVVSVIGITTINQYDKMIAVENAMLELAQAMKENNTWESAGGESAPVMQTQIQETVTTDKDETEKDETEKDEIEEDEIEEDRTEDMEKNDPENIPITEGAETKSGTDTATGSKTEPEQSMESETGMTQNTGSGIKSDTESNTEKTQTIDTQTAPAEHEIYYVQEGDTLAAISYRYYQTTLKVSEICQMNQIKNPDSIMVGEKILLP